MLRALERPAAGEAAGALVLLHGRGADEYDLFPLLDAIDPERRLHGFTPRGPLSLPPGGAHWYALGGIPTPPKEHFDASLAELRAFVGGLPYDRIVIGGFSQGCVMSYALSLGEGSPRPAALLALSGFIPRVPGFELDLESPFPPIVVAHGTYDPVIPVAFGREARDLLTGAGATVDYRESPIEHSIDPQLIPLLRDVVAGA
ncbi:MAG: phospholipase [Actinomycetota bacterium]